MFRLITNHSILLILGRYDEGYLVATDIATDRAKVVEFVFRGVGGLAAEDRQERMAFFDYLMHNNLSQWKHRSLYSLKVSYCLSL